MNSNSMDSNDEMQNELSKDPITNMIKIESKDLVTRQPRKEIKKFGKVLKLSQSSSKEKLGIQEMNKMMELLNNKKDNDSTIEIN